MVRYAAVSAARFYTYDEMIKNRAMVKTKGVTHVQLYGGHTLVYTGDDLLRDAANLSASDHHRTKADIVRYRINVVDI